MLMGDDRDMMLNFESDGYTIKMILLQWKLPDYSLDTRLSH